MIDYSQWLPALIKLSDFAGNWQKYIDFVYSVFYRDFIESRPEFQRKYVRCRKDPIFDGKEAGFWHCISQGRDENQRTPNLERCERIGWIRAVIENCCYKDIKQWSGKKNSDNRIYLWFNEEYIVVLGVRNNYFQLITAFCTDRKHTAEKLRKEYQRSQKN